MTVSSHLRGSAMRLHVINHVPFEGPGYIAEWATERGHKLTESFALTEEFPRFDEVDFIVVMGGSMSADDHEGNPWLLAEKRYLNRSIGQGMPILGVCMGAQILAEVTGGRVRRNDQREIGWYPVSLTDFGHEDPVFSAFPDGLVVGHWHGDTFDLPVGVKPTLSNATTYNQAFSLMGGRIVGLQCHLEWSPEDLRKVMDACPDDLLEEAQWVTPAEEFEAQAASYVPACREALFGLLDRMQALAEER